MKNLLFLALFFLVSCSKNEDITYIKANLADSDLIKSAIKIEKKYDPIKNNFQIWFYSSDSIATMYDYYFQYNGGSVYMVDLRVKYKKYSLYEYTTGKLTKEKNKINGTLYTNKVGGSIEFKNYQL